MVDRSIKILLTGASGNLSGALRPLLESRGDELFLTDLKAPEGAPKGFHVLDIRDPGRVSEIFQACRPELALHLAAATDVDRCETHPEEAFGINVQGTENIARACKAADIPLVYLSTAEVFNGQKKTPYTEDDATGPVNTYAKTKLQGEEAVLSNLKRYYVVRTAWLFGGGKTDKKFVGKIVRLLDHEKEIKAVSDKIGSPTYVVDLARNIMALTDSGKYGLYHMCNRGSCSRYDMAKKIVEVLGKKDVKVVPVTSESFKMPAPRGRSEAMENSRLEKIGLNFMPPWEKSLEDYLKKEF